jgi:ribonucleoside-diphosphate reductase beta chain
MMWPANDGGGPVTDLLNSETRQELEEARLGDVGKVNIDDMLEYVHEDMPKLPEYLDLYSRYLRQRWNVDELDFTQDKIDWREKMTEEERSSFLAIASGFHHGERQVEIELPVFMLGATEEQKIFISSQIEDEARHTVFFDRFYREVVGLEGEGIMGVLDASYEWVSEVFVGPFGLLAYLADAVRKDPENQSLRMQYATTYFLWIEGVLALTVMKVTLSYARNRGFLPAYYTGFTATCRDEARHVQFGLRVLREGVHGNPALLRDVHETLSTILSMAGAESREVYYEPLGWNREQLLEQMLTQLTRKVNMMGIGMPPDFDDLMAKMAPVLAGG